MKTLEIEATLERDLTVHLPEEMTPYLGQTCKVLLLFGIVEKQEEKTSDLMCYSGTIPWPVDGLAYQQTARSEWP